MNSSAPRSDNRTFLVEGLDCAEEISALLHEVEPLVGDRDKLDFNVFSQTMTVAPSSAKRRAMAAPNPCAAPVTSAILFFIRIVNLPLAEARRWRASGDVFYLRTSTLASFS